MKHSGPEQGVKIEYVFTDKMVELGRGVRGPKGVEVNTPRGAEVAEACHVPNRCIEPDIKVLPRRVWNFEPEVGCIAGDIPVLKADIKPLV